MDSEKRRNSFDTKKQEYLHNYLLDNCVLYRFVNIFPASILCKINVLNIFNKQDSF